MRNPSNQRFNEAGDINSPPVISVRAPTCRSGGHLVPSYNAIVQDSATRNPSDQRFNEARDICPAPKHTRRKFIFCGFPSFVDEYRKNLYNKESYSRTQEMKTCWV